MTKEEKALLFQVLCAMFPYRLMCNRYANAYELVDIDIKRGLVYLLREEQYVPYSITSGDVIKPYLRSLSSMTEEEKIELYKISGFYYLSNNELLKDEWRQFSDAFSENELFLPYPIWGGDLNKVYDWLNKKHFDYCRGYDEKSSKWKTMIELGLALSAPKGIYTE